MRLVISALFHLVFLENSRRPSKISDHWPIFYHNDRHAVLLILFSKVSPYYLFRPLFRLHEGDFSNSFGSIRQPGWKFSLIFVFQGLIFWKNQFNSIFERICRLMKCWDENSFLIVWHYVFFHRIGPNHEDFKGSFRIVLQIIVKVLFHFNPLILYSIYRKIYYTN